LQEASGEAPHMKGMKKKNRIKLQSYVGDCFRKDPRERKGGGKGQKKVLSQTENGNLLWQKTKTKF